MIETEHPKLSIRRQCDLVGLHRSNYYYEPAPETPEIREIIERALEHSPDHPALAHLYIHTMEAGPEAAEQVRREYSRRYPDLADDAVTLLCHSDDGARIL